MIKALWYRHWVDTRGGLIVAIPMTILLCFLFVIKAPMEPMVSAPDKPDTMYAQASPEALRTLPPEENVQVMKALEHHTMLTIYASLLLVLFLWGSGIRSNYLKACHPSIYFNLTLPVSRATLVCTRFLVSILFSVILMGMLLASNILVMWMNDIHVPVGLMLYTSIMGLMVLLAGMAVYTFFAMLSENVAAGLIPLALVVYLLVMSSWRQSVHYVFLPDAYWLLILLLVTGLSLAGAAKVAKIHDF